MNLYRKFTWLERHHMVNRVYIMLCLGKSENDIRQWMKANLFLYSNYHAHLKFDNFDLDSLCEAVYQDALKIDKKLEEKENE